MQTQQNIHTRKRGAVHKEAAKAVLVWFPHKTIDLLDRAVETQDTDRSKFIRRAVKERLATLGIAEG